MSGVSFKVDDTRVRDALRSLTDRLRHPRPALEDIGQTLVSATDMSFRSQKDPWGDSWARLRASTLLARRKGNGPGGDKILRDTGHLANSINHRATNEYVEVGTNVKYATTHQFGAKKGAFGRTRRGAPIPWGDIPARPFLPIRQGGVDLPKDLLDEILSTLRAHAQEAL